MNEMWDEGPVFGSGLIPMFASILLLAGLFVGYKTYAVDHNIGLAIMIGAAIPALIVAWQIIRLRRALGTATLQMNEDVVPMGWSGTATYVRPLRGATIRTIEARLQCEEHVERGGGRNRREWRKVVVDEPLAVQTAPMMEQMRVTIPIKIPVAGPPTFYINDNEINWWVRLHLIMDGCPNTRSSFKLLVMPAVVER
jgi:hypothetical protein